MEDRPGCGGWPVGSDGPLSADLVTLAECICPVDNGEFGAEQRTEIKPFVQQQMPRAASSLGISAPAGRIIVHTSCAITIDDRTIHF